MGFRNLRKRTKGNSRGSADQSTLAGAPLNNTSIKSTAPAQVKPQPTGCRRCLLRRRISRLPAMNAAPTAIVCAGAAQRGQLTAPELTQYAARQRWQS